MTTWPYHRFIAHRGAGKLAPENTLAAFALGAKNGFRMFECDVKLSSDGVLFLLHDDTLERTTNGFGVAGNLPWVELAQLDAGSWHSSAFAGEPLPTLQGVAQFCLSHGCLLNLEIKPTPGLEAETGTTLANQAALLWPAGSTPPLLSSFKTDSLQAARDAQPQLPRALLLDELRVGWLQEALELECIAIVCEHALWNEYSVAQAQEAGLHTASYGANDETAIKRQLALGIESVITDLQERLLFDMHPL